MYSYVTLSVNIYYFGFDETFAHYLFSRYGVARSTAAGMAELRSAIFSSVAHKAIRTVALDIFEHLHRLDLQFHLDRNTGQLSRIIDRGSRSINFALSAMLFNVVPTILEVALVTGMILDHWKTLHINALIKV
jgi:hypothetical protein